MFHHALRVSEACQLRVNDVESENKLLHIKRLKNGKQIPHPLFPDDLKALRAWLKERSKMIEGHSTTDYLFISERRRPLHRATVWLMIGKAAEAAGLAKLKVHPHSLRHSAGFYLVDKLRDTGSGVTDIRLVQDFLGHKNIQNTAIYTQTDPQRFKNLF
jgi:type 1 fimbriae regulatory protein FimB